MPTGYTAPIADGITFEDFALRCARNFGALITMRDDPTSAPIPVFAPSPFYAQSVEKSRTKIAELSAMSPEDAEIAALAEHDREIASREKYTAEKRALKVKYEAMLEQARAWAPPTPDHAGLHRFMIEQIEESIKWDCAEYEQKPITRKTGERWLADALAVEHANLSRYIEERDKEIERTTMRNRWVADLRASLATAAPSASP